MGEFINLLNVQPKYYDGPRRNMDPTFGVLYFDGTRDTGCGGYKYMPGFWNAAIANILSRYGLKAGHKVLDLGCAKGFFMADLIKTCPGIEVRGIDISEYAIANAVEEIKPFVSVGSADDLSAFADHSFDFVAGMNTLHFLTPERAKVALQEIVRVGRGKYFVQVDSFHNEVERERMLDWAPIIKTVFYPEQWEKLFAEAGYDGDYWWTIVKPQSEMPEKPK